MIINYLNWENRSNDYSNRISDLNPNDVESVTVLKGPEATALYGNLGAGGAIIITTKKAKITAGKKLNVSYDNSFRFQSLGNVPAVYTGFQQGSNGIASSGTFSACALIEEKMNNKGNARVTQRCIKSNPPKNNTSVCG